MGVLGGLCPPNTPISFHFFRDFLKNLLLLHTGNDDTLDEEALGNDEDDQR